MGTLVAEQNVRPDEAKSESRLMEADDERLLLCAKCGHGIASPGARFEQAGKLVHTCVNPSGIVFTLGCFRDAPGCAILEPPSFEFSWFSGYAWRIALCANCGEHLGWRFDGKVDGFYGLILAKLVE